LRGAGGAIPPVYSPWLPPTGSTIHYATFKTLLHSCQLRFLPKSEGVLQNFHLKAQKHLAKSLALHIDTKARHLIVSQSLLPHLWMEGHLGGRTFEVLMNRLPLKDLHQRLDEIADIHVKSDTLKYFRADPELVQAESLALLSASKIITPHVGIAKLFGDRAILIDWEIPSFEKRITPPQGSARWFFPASAVARKGINELSEVLREIDGELLILGKAREGTYDPLENIRYRSASIQDLDNCTALVLPAWIEHEPRMAILALAKGIPVIASRACGLPPHPKLIEVDAGDVESLKKEMQKCAGI